MDQDDAMETGLNKDNIVQNIQQMLNSKAEFDDLWVVLDSLTTFITVDKKQNYVHLKDVITNVVKYAEEFPKISGSVNEIVKKIRYVNKFLI